MVEKALREYKGYNLGPRVEFNLVEIKAKGQGFVPKPLQGLYTTYSSAQKAVDVYLESLKKGKRNATKTKGTGTS